MQTNRKSSKKFLKERKWYDRWLRKADNSARHTSIRTHRLNSSRGNYGEEVRV